MLRHIPVIFFAFYFARGILLFPIKIRQIKSSNIFYLLWKYYFKKWISLSNFIKIKLNIFCF